MGSGGFTGGNLRRIGWTCGVRIKLQVENQFSEMLDLFNNFKLNFVNLGGFGVYKYSISLAYCIYSKMEK